MSEPGLLGTRAVFRLALPRDRSCLWSGPAGSAQMGWVVLEGGVSFWVWGKRWLGKEKQLFLTAYFFVIIIILKN